MRPDTVVVSRRFNIAYPLARKGELCLSPRGVSTSHRPSSPAPPLRPSTRARCTSTSPSPAIRSMICNSSKERCVDARRVSPSSAMLVHLLNGSALAIVYAARQATAAGTELAEGYALRPALRAGRLAAHTGCSTASTHSSGAATCPDSTRPSPLARTSRAICSSASSSASSTVTESSHPLERPPVIQPRQRLLHNQIDDALRRRPARRDACGIDPICLHDSLQRREIQRRQRLL